MQKGSTNLRMFLHESRRNKTGKGGSDRFHTKGTHTLKYLMLKRNLVLMP